MAEAATALGIASFGIQVCQGLLSYSDRWKSYDSDISDARDSVSDLNRTLTLLEARLKDKELNRQEKEQVEKGLESCKEGLEKLSGKCQELRQYGKPECFRQKARSKIQRAQYPFLKNTLLNTRGTVDDIRERLKFAVQVLQLTVSATSKKVLGQMLSIQQSEHFEKIRNWLSPPNPETNHTSARQRHESETGSWLLQSSQYQRWKAGPSSGLWLYGKAGCGKTVLCSTVIEDIRMHCNNVTTKNSGHAVFYFSFSDDQKQSYDNLLRSLVVQLGWKEPSLSMLMQAYKKPDKRPPSVAELEKILLAAVRSYDEMFFLLDALDECPEAEDQRQGVLEGLARLWQGARNIRALVTSRGVSDVRAYMIEELGADTISIKTNSVDADIRKWISSQLLRDPKLKRLNATTRSEVEQTISSKADGMFRWAYCQLQELKKLKSMKPKYVENALLSLPATLDATYERMLTSIEDVYRPEALTLLRWLVYARSPPTLGELAEAVIIDPTGDGVVDLANRGSLEDTLDILGPLVLDQGAGDTSDGDDGNDEDNNNDEDDPHSNSHHRSNDDDGEDDEVIEEEDEVLGNGSTDSTDDAIDRSRSVRRIRQNTKIRLAHFSVQEYLKSERIVQSGAKDFSLREAKEHRFIAQSCLTYLIHYSGSQEKTSTEQDLISFPLLEYAARSWYYHSWLQQTGDVSREVHLLSDRHAKCDWLKIHRPDKSWEMPLTWRYEAGTGVYYASHAGLEDVVQILIDTGADVNARGGCYGNALQAASEGGHEKVVQMLIDAGADVNAQGGRYGNALQAASEGGYEMVVQMLIDAGADVNAHGGRYGNALQAASAWGYEKVVQVLIDAGADVNAQGGDYGNALQAASLGGYEKVVQMLMDAGADVNAQGGYYSNALQAASARGYKKIVQMLIDAGETIMEQP